MWKIVDIKINDDWNKQLFSMLADPRIKHWYVWKHNLLKSSVIYKDELKSGNNIFDHLKLFQLYIKQSYKKDNISDCDWLYQFEINFYLQNILYNYSFIVNRDEVVFERLRAYKSQKPTILFVRDKENWVKIKSFDSNDSTKRVNKNNLALPIFAFENSEEAEKIYDFFKNIELLDNPSYDCLDFTIELRGVVFVENLNLNPLLMKSFINSEQLIFNTNITNLLNDDNLRKDQIWFIDWNDLYSLLEFKWIRKNLDIENLYLKWRFGAIPFIT